MTTMSPEPLKTSTPKSRHREFFEKLYGSLETSGKSSTKLGKIAITQLKVMNVGHCKRKMLQNFDGFIYKSKKPLHSMHFPE